MPSSKPRQRFQDIIDSIDEIAEVVAEAGGINSAMHGKRQWRRAVERSLSILSEAASKLGSKAEQLEPSIRWDKIRGIGNYLRHNYDDLNEEILLDVMRNGLTPLRAACVRALSVLPEA